MLLPWMKCRYSDSKKIICMTGVITRKASRMAPSQRERLPSQPRPINSRFRPGAFLDRLTASPLDRLTGASMVLS